MPVPKRKRSRSRRDKRFANKALKMGAFALCPQCQEPIVGHVACRNCGYYKGKKVILTKAERGVKRIEKKEEKGPVESEEQVEIEKAKSEKNKELK